MTIGEKIKYIRRKKEMSLREFSRLVNLSHTNIARFEKGFDSKGNVKGSIQIDDLRQICDRTGYPFRQFLEETGYIEAVPSAPKSEIQELYDSLDPGRQKLVLKYIATILPEEEKSAKEAK